MSVEDKLFRAIRDHSVKKVVKYIAAGVNVNATEYEGDTPLMIAMNWGNVKIIRHLLRAGARIDMFNKIGRTALLNVSFYTIDEEKRLQILKLLLEQPNIDSCINATDKYGLAPITCFAPDMLDDFVCIKALLKAGADITDNSKPNARHVRYIGPFKVNTNPNILLTALKYNCTIVKCKLLVDCGAEYEHPLIKVLALVKKLY